VTPGAKRTQITGIHDGALQVKLSARPVDGAANRALVDHLRRLLGVSKRSVAIERGEKARRKTVLITETRGPVDPLILLPSSRRDSRPAR